MKTKSLLLAAVAVCAGSAPAYAATSSNIVGYTRLSLKTGFNLVGNTLDNKSGNDVTVLFGAIPGDSTVFRWNGAGFNALDKVGDGADEWGDTGYALAPGEAVFVQVAHHDADVVLVGEVLTGQQDINIAKGNNFVASRVPQAGKLDTDLGLVPEADDTVFTWTNGSLGFTSNDYLGDGNWGNDAAPVLAVGQGIVLQHTANTTYKWSRNFVVP